MKKINNAKRVHVLLKDGTYLDCVIFDLSDMETGQAATNNEELIHELFSKENRSHDNFRSEFVWFQTDYINGHFHPMNVLWYEIQ